MPRRKRKRTRDYRGLAEERTPILRQLIRHIHPLPIADGVARDVAGMGELWEAQQLVISEILALEDRARRREECRDDGAWELVLRAAADALAWLVIGPDNLWIARRLCRWEQPPRLSTSNWQAALPAAKRLGEEGGTFYVLSDLTTFCQLGDLVGRDADGRLQIVEVKEGEMNRRLLALREAVGEVNAVDCAKRLLGDSAAKQLERIRRQERRMLDTQDLLNTGQGKDQLGEVTRIPGPTRVLCTYSEELEIGIAFARQRGWAIGVVEDCVFWAIYRDTPNGGLTFQEWLRGVGFDGPITDYLAVLRSPVMTSPFVAYPVANFVEELLQRRFRLLLGLDLNKLIELGNQEGMEMRWLSRKETAKRKGKGLREAYTWKKRAIAARVGNEESLVGDGIPGRVLYGFVEPHCALGLLALALGPD